MQTYPLPEDLDEEQEPCECNGTGVLGYTDFGFGGTDYCHCDEGARLEGNEQRAYESRYGAL